MKNFPKLPVVLWGVFSDDGLDLEGYVDNSKCIIGPFSRLVKRRG